MSRRPAYAPKPGGPPYARRALSVVLFIALLVVPSRTAQALILLALLVIVGRFAYRHARRFHARRRSRPGVLGPATVSDLHHHARQTGGGAYLATGPAGEWVSAPPQAAVLVLAGPRAGKTSCVVIPALTAHPGAAVATSTKPEVLQATLAARQQLGDCWHFDLTGHGTPPGCRALRWSPITGATDWQQAQLVAEAMTGATDHATDASHWTERASALLAGCLYAAARSGQDMRALQGWVLRHDTDAPLAELDPDSLAADVLEGIKRTADRERSGIFSTASRVLRAYRSPIAQAASKDPTFSPDAFAASTDTVYVAAAAHEQQLLAPLVVGLLTEIRQATYRHAWQHPGPARAPVLVMLDEAANIAPIPDLPAMLSEAGGQGLQVVVVLQDISQARRRWPRDADGLLSLFGARVILAGIADVKTLEQLSLLAGDWDRPVQTITTQRPASLFGPASQRTRSESWTTRRERRLPPDHIAQMPQGEALVMIGPDWQLLPTLPYNRHPTFAPLTTPAARASTPAS